MSIHEIRVLPIDPEQQISATALDKLRLNGITSVFQIDQALVYWIEGISDKQAQLLSNERLTNPVTKVSTVNSPIFENGNTYTVGYRPGVTDPWRQNVLTALKQFGITPTALATAREYRLHGTFSPDELETILQLLPSQVEQIYPHKPETLVISDTPAPVETIALRALTGGEHQTLSKQRSLFLNQEEMTVIQNHFQTIGREPTDIELETLAQTWSEHNGHKTFKANIVLPDGTQKPPLFTRLKETSEQFFRRVGVMTAFKDNSGGIDFYDGWSIILKGETHNSPVAIEPFGGSQTKNGGLYRDIAGTGKGGINLVSFMVNNFPSPFTPHEQVPQGCLHPQLLLMENFRGEASYGNQMGIPTHGLTFHFHPDFLKPTSMGIAIGMIENENVEKGTPHPGDYVVSVGGRTGRDGIHGATFSSGEMTADTKNIHATAVQLGDAIMEKSAFDALTACKKENLIRALTDVGGGGYSSAIGEIGAETGVAIHLDRVPLKYQGLSPWEIWLSESQERMIVAVDPDNWPRFLEVCNEYASEATVIGNFTDDHELTLVNNGEIVGQLSMEFLHDGLPQRTMEARFEPYPEDMQVPELPVDWTEAYKKVLGHLNVCSKQVMHDRYDKTIQGRTVLEPYTGEYSDMPNDGSVLQPFPDAPYGIVTALGGNPILNRLDSYWGSVWATAVAAARFTAIGGDLRYAAAADNFVAPKPTPKVMGDLDQSVDGMCETLEALQIPLVSGKDSLSSTFTHAGGTQTEIPLFLNMTIMGKIPDTDKTTSADIKRPDIATTLCLVGVKDINHLGGSVYFDTQGIVNSAIPQVNLTWLPQVLKTVREGIENDQIYAAKAIGEGGIATALALMCFGGDCGAEIDLDALNAKRPDFALFNETAGCMLVEVPDIETAEDIFSDIPYTILGVTTSEKVINVSQSDEALFSVDTDSLKAAWKKPFNTLMHHD